MGDIRSLSRTNGGRCQRKLQQPPGKFIDGEFFDAVFSGWGGSLVQSRVHEGFHGSKGYSVDSLPVTRQARRLQQRFKK